MICRSGFLLMVALMSLSLGCNKNKKNTQPTVVNKTNDETNDVAAQTARRQAMVPFSQRDDPKKLNGAIILLEKSAKLDNNPDTWLLVARSYEMSGRLLGETANEIKRAAIYYQKGSEAAKMSLEGRAPGSTSLNTPPEERFAKIKPEDAAALYEYALLQWRWAQTQGTAVELSLRRELFAAALRVKELSPELLGAAPYRLLGEMYAELPAFAGGDLDLSLEHFKQSIMLAPAALENRGSFARTYGKKADPELAAALLQEIVEANPDTIRDLAPENRVEQKKAKASLHQ